MQTIPTILTTGVSTSVLAVITTIHLAILLLRWHRLPKTRSQLTLLIPSVVLAAMPWLFSSPIGLAVGLVLHMIWFVACERLVPAPRASEKTPPAVPRQTPHQEKPVSTPPTGSVQVPVIGVFPETDDITTFRMVRPDGYNFRAGQFLTVRINVDGRPEARCYSVSSAPEAGGYLEISVKRQGLVSGTLHATVRPGSLLEVKKPMGAFNYPSDDQRPITLLAGGVGITPLMSMLRHSYHADPTRPVTLLYSVHNESCVAFRDELSWLAKRHPYAKVVVTATRGPRSTDLMSGRIDRQMIENHVSDFENNIFMICGPTPMIEGLTSLLTDLGVDPGQVRSEAFAAAVASASQDSQSQEPEEAPETTGDSYRLQLVSSNQTIAADSGTTLLETCEAAGTDIPSACRAGVCGTCRTRLVSGKVRCDSDLLDEAEQAEGYILPCVAWPEEDCALEA